ncbi:hypothetical protein [Reticulibacter mediterranei]|nr:hypothetical protein [Reticulibacter mediterranei]
MAVSSSGGRVRCGLGALAPTTRLLTPPHLSPGGAAGVRLYAAVG